MKRRDHWDWLTRFQRAIKFDRIRFDTNFVLNVYFVSRQIVACALNVIKTNHIIF